MCVVSMITDHYLDRWGSPGFPRTVTAPVVYPFMPAAPVFPTKDEIDEFYRLLARAREYDIQNNQPNCELDEKRQKLLDLAKELGVEITFDILPIKENEVG